MLKKFLAIIISVISIYTPCTTNFCLANSCQIDFVKSTPKGTNSCGDQHDVEHYLSRKWIDAMCEKDSKLSKFFKHPATMAILQLLVPAVFGAINTLGSLAIQGAFAAKSKKDDKKGSFGLINSDFKGYCDQMLEISNNNKKCGVIVKYQQFIKDNLALFTEAKIDPQTN